ncbi:MAG: serine/threonine protein kinase [Betaproteobacteria bacterium]|jgi:serine/threonine protein kinase|nr:serine/threonine protein kinase [Betaproteobacteria bacterium]
MSTSTPIDPEERTVIPGPLVEGNALPAGTRLGEFEVIGLIGEGGFGIVYLAYDHSLDRKVALKEYMPSALAERQGSTSVKVKSQRNAETFSAGLRSFINEARLLAQFDHPSLVKVYRFWVANGTAYMVMPFYEGITLKEALRRRGGAPDEAWLKSLLSQLLDALDTIHSRQCYHRDIAPDNILMLSDNVPVLLDFGAARRVIGNSAQTLTVILKPGYAPIEQYAEAPNLKQGPWTDIYALGSVVYFAITGHAPAPAVARVISDPLVPLSQVADGRYSDAFIEGIQSALAVRPDERPQDIESFRAVLGFPKPQSKAQPRQPEAEPTRAPTTTPTVSSPTPRVTQPSQPPVATSRSTVSASPPPTIGPSVDAQVERLLAQYIGPMARIFCARAHKTARTPDELTKCLAEAIDDDTDRTAFIAAAAKLLRAKRH